jgi:hypothetical protein
MATKKKDARPQLHLTRPVDRSLEAFKSWMQGMVQHLVPGAPSTMTDQDWIREHKAFWKAVDEAQKKNE